MSESFQEFCKRILPAVQAGVEGKNIKTKPRDRDNWNPVGENCGVIRRCLEYRIAEPKATPLPITPEMWAMINPFYVCAVMNDHGEILFCSQVTEWSDDDRKFGCEYGFGDCCKSPLIINTFGVIPELSLTKRPDNYVIDNDVDVGSVAVHDDDEVIASIKKTAEDGRKHGVRIAVEEFNKEHIIRDVAAETNGTDYIVTEHYNPITGITQTIRTKIR